MKYVAMVLLTLGVWIGSACGHTGAGSVLALRAGDFKSTEFPGTQAGVDSAYSFAGTNGWVQIGPGCESYSPSGTDKPGVLVVRTGTNGWQIVRGNLTLASRTYALLGSAPNGAMVYVPDSLKVFLRQGGAWGSLAAGGGGGGGSIPSPFVLDDSMRINKRASFRDSLNAYGPFVSRSTNRSFTILPGGNIQADIPASLGYMNISNIASNGGWSVHTGGGVTAVQIDSVQRVNVLHSLSVGDSAAILGRVYIGTGGNWINRVLRGSATLNFDLTSQTYQDLTINVANAALGDEVLLGIPQSAITDGVGFHAWVSQAGVVTVRAGACATGPNPGSGTFKVTVIQ